MKPIRIYVRCRPGESRQSTSTIEVDIENHSILITDDRKQAFRYDRVFGTNSSQDDLFDVIGKPHVDELLGGINGTIFAYGQTGSGKTFTITGGLGAYSQRGLIPRILTYLFSPRDELVYTKLNVRTVTVHIYSIYD